jgi:hypothetical protein
MLLDAISPARTRRIDSGSAATKPVSRIAGNVDRPETLLRNEGRSLGTDDETVELDDRQLRRSHRG